MHPNTKLELEFSLSDYIGGAAVANMQKTMNYLAFIAVILNQKLNLKNGLNSCKPTISANKLEIVS